MIKLDKIAAKYFNSYAKRFTSGADWRFLSKERQYEWKLEIAQRIDTCLKELETEIDLPKRTTTGQGSFEKGFLLGEEHENKRLKQKLIELREALESQIEELHESNKD